MMAAGSTANCLALGSDIAPAWSPVSPQCVRGRRGTRRLLTGRKKVWKSIVLQIGTQIGKKTSHHRDYQDLISRNQLHKRGLQEVHQRLYEINQRQI
ncbi:uncharacterized protein LOC106008481 isoform X6 [Heterocephalus glaber]|uniref:Uncharacterized protein LOC106008481 isoform X6 n=1 Tax=Heterocephalus glaber TaxID=10181 RepID=A0AAX6S9C7_HETGA|nr:uncharacterized protein LOC106008481 isoform X6 [Heterocephalus glaber]